METNIKIKLDLKNCSYESNIEMTNTISQIIKNLIDELKNETIDTSNINIKIKYKLHSQTYIPTCYCCPPVDQKVALFDVVVVNDNGKKILSFVDGWEYLDDNWKVYETDEKVEFYTVTSRAIDNKDVIKLLEKLTLECLRISLN